MLLTAEIRTHLRRNADTSAHGEIDHRPVAKFFLPGTSAAWLVSELAPDEDTLFGLADVGHGCPELGYISLSELQSLRGPGRVLVERDRSFLGKKPLSVYASEARTAGRIVA